MMRTKILAGAFMLSCLTGCTTQPVSAPLIADLLAGNTQCDHKDAAGKAVWLGNAAALRTVYDDLNKQQLGAPAPIPPGIDFTNHGVVAVFMGQKPTAGYSLSLNNPQISISNKAAELQLVFATPAPGNLSAQIMTSPCILIKVPRTRQPTLRIVDQHGGLRHQIKLP